jgi:hypothetical protein
MCLPARADVHRMMNSTVSSSDASGEHCAADLQVAPSEGAVDAVEEENHPMMLRRRSRIPRKREGQR